jgi:hypothetical protein
VTTVPTTGRARPHVFTTWASTTLRKLGITPNRTNRVALDLWRKSEGQNTPNTGYNWLNTTLPAPGATTLPGNPDHVKIYPDYQSGVAATAASLKLPAYSNVLRALATKAGTATVGVNRAQLAKVWTAINQSPWAGKLTWAHATTARKQYPGALYSVLQGGKIPLTSSGQSQTTGTPTGTKLLPPGGCTCTPKLGGWKVGPFCVLNKCELRAVKGGALVVAGGLVMFVGLALIAAGGLGRTGPLGQVRRATRAVGIGGGSSSRRSQPSTREADAQVRNASPEQLRGQTTPSSAGLRRDYNRQQSPPVHTGPFDERDRTADLAARRAARERRPRAPQRRAA